MSLAKYSFLSWIRQGLSKYAIAPTGSKSRASLDVSIQESKSGGLVTNNIQLYGPGDVTGIDLRNIVKVHPEPNTGNFESNYLPFIEFYQDSFLWDYTPEPINGNKLDPWLFLLVLEEGTEEYQKTEVQDGLSYITVDDLSVFPPTDQRWAWCHVHVNAEVNGVPSLQTKLTSNPDYAVCRLMSPRKLEPNKRYEAFVIPAYEVGRLAGLGEKLEIEGVPIQGANVLKSSWEGGKLTYPFYFSWSFSTGAEGDFEALVRALKPSPELDASIGFRPIDVTEGKLKDLVFEPKKSDGTPMKEYVLGGALKPVGSSSQDFPDTSWQKEMVDLLNKRDGVQDLSYDGSNSSPDNDPIIVPPTYGHWHALVSKLNKGLKQMTIT
ncbi:MAG: hypothetical protein IPH93_00015 [Saprospiraceae bacterium]|nr:hypothetical protein [Saprospiraceae bacterium]